MKEIEVILYIRKRLVNDSICMKHKDETNIVSDSFIDDL